MKLLLLTCSLFLTLFNYTPKSPIKMDCLAEEVETIDYKFNSFTVKEYQEINELYYKGEKVSTFSNSYINKYFEDDKYFYIFSKPSYKSNIKILVYSKDKGKLFQERTINNIFIGPMDVILDDDNFIIVSSVEDLKIDRFINAFTEKEYLDKVNGVIFKYNIYDNITDCNIFGGRLDDLFYKIYKDETSYYVTGIKDQESGGDFGNGGNSSDGGNKGKGYLLVRLNKNFSTFTYKVFKEEIKSLEISDKIYCFTNKHMYTFDYGLNQELGLKFASDCIFGKNMFNYMVAVFTRSNLNIYDYKKNKLIDKYDFKFDNSITDVIYLDNELYLLNNDIKYKTIFYDKKYQDFTFIYDNINDSKIPNTIISLPMNLNLSDIKYEDSYNEGVFGLYDMDLYYDNVVINSKMKVLERTNITNGCIYPVGYKLLFSGTGYLNGEEVYNNYKITHPGDYQLKLIGKDKEVIKDFKVMDMDINYSDDQLKAWDYEVYKDQDLFIDLNIDNIKDIEIKSVIVNNKEQDFKFDKANKKITVIFNESNEGLYTYNLEKIVYVKDNTVYEEMINEEFSVKVIGDKINLEQFITNDKKHITISLNVLNNNDSLRFIKMKTKGDNEKVYYIPFKNGDININTSELGIEDVDFFLVYDNKRKYYEEVYLFSANINFKNKKLGKINLEMENEMVNKIDIILESDEKLMKISVDDEVIYEYTEHNSYIPIIITASLVVLFFVFYKIYKVNKKKKIMNK